MKQQNLKIYLISPLCIPKKTTLVWQLSVIELKVQTFLKKTFKHFNIKSLQLTDNSDKQRKWRSPSFAYQFETFYYELISSNQINVFFKKRTETEKLDLHILLCINYKLFQND